ncbi:hypothetical protein [Microbacterium sp. LWH10-1.2]|uniref:hypothetical protein n=1 Tax=Microbacterium sp. LWH10-1.2 TaxID=3135255 RepID=UPI003138D112
MTILDLTVRTLTREGQTWLLRFPHIRNWFHADPETDAATYRGLTLDDIATALGYATSLVAIASAYLRVLLELDDCDDIFCQVDEGDPSIHVSTSVPNARQSITRAIAEAAKVLSGEASTTGATDAASDLIVRQRDRGRRESIDRRLAVLAQGDEALHSRFLARIPNMFTHLDAAEAAVSELESQVSAADVQLAAARAVAARTHAEPGMLTHVNEHTMEGSQP